LTKCKKQAYYNTEGEKQKYCKTHKTNEMVNVGSRKCIHIRCNTRSYYNTEGETKGLYCKTHKTEEMIDVKNQRCIHNRCISIILLKYEVIIYVVSSNYQIFV